MKLKNARRTHCPFCGCTVSSCVCVFLADISAVFSRPYQRSPWNEACQFRSGSLPERNSFYNIGVGSNACLAILGQFHSSQHRGFWRHRLSLSERDYQRVIAKQEIQDCPQERVLADAAAQVIGIAASERDKASSTSSSAAIQATAFNATISASTTVSFDDAVFGLG